MILHVVIRNVVYFFVVTSQECIPGHLHFSYKFHLYFCKQEMRYCSEDAPRTGERNVNCNKKTTSENVVLNKMFHPDERAPSFIFRQKNGHDLRPSSTNQKTVLSSSRGQGIFEDLHLHASRPRTSNCVLEAKDLGCPRGLLLCYALCFYNSELIIKWIRHCCELVIVQNIFNNCTVKLQ